MGVLELLFNINRRHFSSERNLFKCKPVQLNTEKNWNKNSSTHFSRDSNVANSSNYFSLSSLTSKKKEYEGRKLFGFTMEQMFDVVSDVENYKHFIPFCKKSDVNKRMTNELWGQLEIGFPPLSESYVSHVTMNRPNFVKADCTDGKLFDHLVAIWRFSPGLRDHAQTSVVNFYLSFQFRSLLHSQMAHLFFNELVRQMESAFFTEAKRRYGEPSIETVKLKLKRKT